MAAMQERAELESRARAMVYRMAEDCTGGKQVCHFTCSIYDTAWVSMVHKSVDNQEIWLFPESFQYILDRQLSHGGWQNYEPEHEGVACGPDGIVNTAAALLALHTHRASNEIIGCCPVVDLDERISRASSALGRMLQDWDLHDLIGVEVVVPAHLRMLERYGMKFSFPGWQQLEEKYLTKLKKCQPQHLYSKTVSTILFSLEGVIGEIDFDRVAHQKTQGGMMSSVSSTAAYIINAKTWDLEAENYLRRAIRDGGVPFSYPTTIFEIIWVLKTFFVAGFSPTQLDLMHVERLAEFLEDTFRQQNGVVGWAPGLIHDSDDTACAMYVLDSLGRSTSAESLFRAFESEYHFRTFELDGSASPSVNANILNTLLHTANPSAYRVQISKTASFICNCWWQGNMNDKWNNSETYTIMSMSQALVNFLEKRVTEQTLEGPEDLSTTKLPITLFGMLVRLLQLQTPEGSWGPKHAQIESTAYAIIALKTLASLPLADRIRTQLDLATSHGQKFLSEGSFRWGEADRIWIGKSMYGCSVFTETYPIAALYMKTPSHQLNLTMDSMYGTQDELSDTIFRNFTNLPFFAETPTWQFDTCMVEAHLYQPLLKRVGQRIFPRQDIKVTKHLKILPFLFTASDHLHNGGMCPNVLLEVMATSLFLYEIDHYMEAVLYQLGSSHWSEVRKIICKLTCADLASGKTVAKENFTENANPTGQTPSPENSNSEAIYAEIEQTLSKFVEWTLSDSSILGSTTYEQNLLRRELRTFLLAHVTSIEESSHLSTMTDGVNVPMSESSTFFDWVHDTSANHVGGTLVFPRMICLLSGQRKSTKEIFDSPEAKYLAQDLCKHLAILCRMENDYGSVTRDLHEHNLNSVHFLGSAAGNDHPAEKVDILEARKSLRQLAVFEREYYERDMQTLKPLIDVRTLKALRTFCNAADLGGQMYAVDDFSPKIDKV